MPKKYVFLKKAVKSPQRRGNSPEPPFGFLSYIVFS